MKNQTENSSEPSLEVNSENNSVSVYAVNFTPLICEDPESEVRPPAAEKDDSGDRAGRNTLSGSIFKWRNAIAVSAIFTVGLLHLVFQLSFQREISKKGRAVSLTAEVKLAADEFAESKPVKIEKKTDDALTRKNASAPKQRQPATSPARPLVKKKVFVETRAARLRRVERILTGV